MQMIHCDKSGFKTSIIIIIIVVKSISPQVLITTRAASSNNQVEHAQPLQLSHFLAVDLEEQLQPICKS